MSSPDAIGTMGYADRVSVAPGEAVRLHVSSSAPTWSAQLVRLRSLEIREFGVPGREDVVERIAPIEREAIVQHTAVGSYVSVDPAPPAGLEDGLTVALIAMPTLPGRGAQTMIGRRDAQGRAGWSVGLDEQGAPRLWLATDAEPLDLRGSARLVRGCWYLLTAVLDPRAGIARLAAEPVGTLAANRVATGRGDRQAAIAPLPGAPRGAHGAPLLLGCGWLDDDAAPQERYDGRLDRPVLAGAALTEAEAAALPHRPEHPALLAAWDLAAGIGDDGFARPGHVEDRGPHARHGRCVNHPARGVTGHNWRSDVQDFRHAPEEYAAIHFHRTDMTDCRWTPQAEIALPAELPSGVYAIRVTGSDGSVDRVPLIVRPAPGAATARTLLVLSTNSYLAYANDHVDVDSPRTQVWAMSVPTLDEHERFRDRHRELGLSLYEVHADGHGVFYTSWRRPILTMRARAYGGNGPVWQFTSDMQLVDWLDRSGREVDVVCDRDLHEQGVELLGRYACVMTGTHPEYPSEEMLDAYEAYVQRGGRLIYMGGNGMYWVTGYDPEDDQVVEIRRWGGTQAWCAQPGEYHLSFTGRLGGTWRFRGRAPQKTFGVGFVAAGGPFASAGYRRRVPSDSPAAWVFDGVSEDPFGAYGVAGGAAGLEIDAVDEALGTPAGAIVLASSEGHGDEMLEARENFNMTSRVLGGARNPRVRSDLVLVPRDGGGAVFSTGSIAFASSLGHNDGDNDVSRLLGNVVDRCSSGAPVLD